jgi:ppGpp synthetase/RelA/SpoT-type nucleotidyltranferase
VPLTPEMIAESVASYRREQDRYLKLARFVAEQCRRIVEDNAIRATVQWRAKGSTSVDLKLRRYLADEQRRHDFNSVDDVFEKLKDLAGVRITTYVESEREHVVRLVSEAFSVPVTAKLF